MIISLTNTNKIAIYNEMVSEP